MAIGSVKKPPSPGSQSINEAIGLLSAFGKEGGELQSLLEEMKEVQLHNEEIYRELATAINENSQLVAEAKRVNSEEKEKIETASHSLAIESRKVTKKEDEIKDRELALEEKATQFSIEASNANGRIKQRENQLRQAEREVEVLRDATEAEMAKAEKQFNEYSAKLLFLENIKTELSAVLSVIDEN